MNALPERYGKFEIAARFSAEILSFKRGILFAFSVNLNIL